MRPIADVTQKRGHVLAAAVSERGGGDEAR
jgi:hypothetical protein